MQVVILHSPSIFFCFPSSRWKTNQTKWSKSARRRHLTVQGEKKKKTETHTQTQRKAPAAPGRAEVEGLHGSHAAQLEGAALIQNKVTLALERTVVCSFMKVKT